MRRLLTIILLSAAFLGGYYLGHQPNSPDIFARTSQLYNRLTSATNDISAKAEQEETTLTEAAVSYLISSAEQTTRSQDWRSHQQP